MKIGIAGYGFVGKAHEGVLKDYHDLIIYDPALGHYGDLRHADAIIVCVSTPQGSHGGCHMDNVLSIIEDNPNVPILIKSTISLEGWNMLKHMYPNTRITFSPEFLRAATALEDFQNTKTILLGSGNTGFWADIFITAMGNINIDVATAQELIVTKYARNSFLATKVSFFNQIYELCQKAGIDYEAVKQHTTADERIGDSHTTITEERGFGGHCFPKDTKAFLVSAKLNDTQLSILQEAVDYNNSIRKDQV
jgi:UDPglucose 6-dehydrogenase|tara:strand:+ start:377 stop:1129 length:753 start_codon:yes stop_codon:yes gene_type:complete